MTLNDLVDIYEREFRLSREVTNRAAHKHALSVVLREITKSGSWQKIQEEALCARLSRLPGTP